MVTQTPPAQSGTDLAAKAVVALHSDAFVDVPGCCQMFVREVCEAVGGGIGSVMDEYRTGTAAGTWANFRPTQYNVWDNSGSNSGDAPDPGFLQEGDVVYKDASTSGPAGHTAIVINGRRVGLGSDVVVMAENSSYHENPDHAGNVEGAKGYRTQEEFGPFNGVVRLTETQAQADAT